MRPYGMLVTLALLMLIMGLALFLATGPLSTSRDLGMADIPTSELWTDKHGNWMQYYCREGTLCWLVIGRNVPTPKIPAEDDPRRDEEIYAKLRMRDRDYAMMGGRNFYTISPKDLKPCPQLIISLEFLHLLNRLRRDRKKLGTDFNIITTTKNFFEKNYEIADQLKELEAEAAVKG